MQNNPLLKKKGIPECILFVTQRLTKYPLLIEPLIKTGVTTDETNNLRKALSLVKEILDEVNNCVADKERTDRKLDIYHKCVDCFFAVISLNFPAALLVKMYLFFSGSIQNRASATVAINSKNPISSVLIVISSLKARLG